MTMAEVSWRLLKLSMVWLNLSNIAIRRSSLSSTAMFKSIEVQTEAPKNQFSCQILDTCVSDTNRTGTILFPQDLWRPVREGTPDTVFVGQEQFQATFFHVF